LLLQYVGKSDQKLRKEQSYQMELNALIVGITNNALQEVDPNHDPNNEEM